MGRPLRHWEPDTYYHISNRCFQARYYLKPSKGVNKVILGCLARYAQRYGIEIVCYVFMSNHYHIIARAPLGNMSEFMGNFQREVSKRLNPIRNRDNAFWQRRFSAEPILDEKAFYNMVNYVMNNPLNALLVTHVSQWEGLNSWETQLSNDGRITGEYMNHTLLARLQREDPSTPEEEAIEHHTIQLKPPRFVKGANTAERNENLAKHVHDYQKKMSAMLYESEDAETTKQVLADEQSTFLGRSWDYCPPNPKRSRRPLCHTTKDELFETHRKKMWDIRDAYRVAMQKHRQGKKAVRFPEGTIPPGWTRCVGAPEPERSTQAKP